MLAAHMDEVGVIITRITDDGFLKFDFVGGVDRRVAIGKPVVIGHNKVPGVIGLKAVHLVSREERKKAPKTESLYIDIGAKDKESAEKLVELGDYGAFVCQPEEFGDGLFKARAIDDRVGCAIMLKLLEEDLPLDVTFAFTAQEEVGTRGAFGAAFSVTPGDCPGAGDHHRRRPARCGEPPPGVRPRQGAGNFLYGRGHYLRPGTF